MLDQDLSERQRDLAVRIQRACSPSSHYWLHLHTPDDAELDHEVEIRIDIPVDVVFSSADAPQWRLAASKPKLGMVFLRRFQPLTRDAIGGMIAEAVTLAFKYGGRFHSWTHDRHLLDWEEPL
jgi:hypothetical protein